MYKQAPLLALLASAGPAAATLQVDFGSSSSIKSAAKDIAFDVMSYYKGNRSGETLGLLDAEYYWWNSAILWSTMIDYWRYTGDDTYNAAAVEGLTAQNGRDKSIPGPDAPAFLPFNWTIGAGNDDQAFWAIAAMQAAELGFPAAPQGQPSWLDLAQGVFDQQAARWTAEEAAGTCGGGVRWMITPVVDVGYDFKNAPSNAAFLNLAARLARYTGNNTYTAWAEKAWTWLAAAGLMDNELNIFNGVKVANDTACGQINKIQLSYTAAILTEAAAYMYNQTSHETWRTRLSTLTTTTLSLFFPASNNLTLLEPICEPSSTCDPDARLFKGIALRALAGAAQLAPHLLVDTALGAGLKATARVAAATCAGGVRGRECGFAWGNGTTTTAANGRKKRGEGKVTGVQEEMNVLAALFGVVVVRGEVVREVGTVNGTAAAGEGRGTGSGSGSEGPGEKGESAGAGVRVGLGVVVAGLVVAALEVV